MAGLATVLAVATPVLFGSGERSIFHFPSEGDFRLQYLSRTDNERGWPFSVDDGYLMCVWVMGIRAVYFVEDLPDRDLDGGITGRVVVVSADPLDLAFTNIGSLDLFAPFDSIEQLIVRVAPFERLGERLCDQPRGTEIGPGEL
jgi:hypothetical protein